MSRENCLRIASETEVDARKRCIRFDKECPGCLCERFSFGNGSPGLVASDEVLVRFHFSPCDLDDEGRPTTFAFSDVESLGLSVTRDRATDAEMEVAIARRISSARQELTWQSVSLIRTLEVRNIAGSYVIKYR